MELLDLHGMFDVEDPGFTCCDHVPQKVLNMKAEKERLRMLSCDNRSESRRSCGTQVEATFIIV